LQAKAECEAIGAHLITNAEWMALAHDIELTASNWSGGVVGSGYINRGYSAHTSYGDSWTNTAAAPDTGSSYVYNSGANALSSTGNHLYKRTYTLSNGEEIWDMGGNVLEWIDETIDCTTTTCSSSLMPYGASAGSEWCEYYGTVSGFDTIATWGEFTKIQLGPIGNYNSTNQIGRIFTDNSSATPSGNIHVFLRSGFWNYGNYAGVFTIILPRAPDYTYIGAGFRCVK
jgi:formylglycine-generating enzyme required for sulfatase activity